MKNRKYLIIAIVIIASILLLKACIPNKDEVSKDKKSGNEKKQEQKIVPDLIKSSSTFFIGKWELKYKDIIHYANDDIGTPSLDLTKQPTSYNFNHVGEALILEEEYPVVEAQYNDQKFSLKIDLKIVNLVIKGELLDNNNWKGTFEYLDVGGNLLSRCSVEARRDSFNE